MQSRMPRSQLKSFLAASHRMAAEGLLSCSSGNLSWRLPNGRMFITGTGTWLGRLTAAEVAMCRIADGQLLQGCRPSKEIGFHAGVLRARPDVNVVLHFQSPCATTLACSRRQPASYFVILEVPYYVGPVAYVPFHPPGSAGLARAVVQSLRKHDLAILRNHGLVTCGTDVDDVVQKATFFELACRIILGAGRNLRFLPSHGVADLLAERRTLRSKVV